MLLRVQQVKTLNLMRIYANLVIQIQLNETNYFALRVKDCSEVKKKTLLVKSYTVKSKKQKKKNKQQQKYLPYLQKDSDSGNKGLDNCSEP